MQDSDRTMFCPVPIHSSDSGGNVSSCPPQLVSDPILGFAEAEPICSQFYGDDLDLASCEDVIGQVPKSMFALLDSHHNKLQVPARYSSCM